MKKKSDRELDPPPVATRDPQSIEVLRVWAAPSIGQQFVVNAIWAKPEAWGLLLVDIARNVANAYERQGWDKSEVLGLIRDMFDAEWNFPTDEPKDVTDQSKN